MTAIATDSLFGPLLHETQNFKSVRCVAMRPSPYPETTESTASATGDVFAVKIPTLGGALRKAAGADDEDSVEAVARELEAVHVGSLTSLRPIFSYVREGAISPVYRSRLLSALGLLDLSGTVLSELLVEGIGKFASSPSAAIRYGAATCLRHVVERGAELDGGQQRFFRRALECLLRDEVPAVRSAAASVLDP